MENRLSTSEKIKIELSRRNMTQEDLAKKLNVDKVTISNRMTSNAWKPLEVFYMKNALGFEL
jgi:transcriptional regulator with XRE-family HTH domain